jgi:protein-tyrosine phosphatase
MSTPDPTVENQPPSPTNPAKIWEEKFPKKAKISSSDNPRPKGTDFSDFRGWSKNRNHLLSPLLRKISKFAAGFAPKVKASFKNYRFPYFFLNKPKKSHHHTITERKIEDGQTKQGAVILSGIPTNRTLRRMAGLSRFFKSKKSEPKIIQVSMLTAEEESKMGFGKDPRIKHVSIPMLDHGTIDATTGKNISIAKFKEQMLALKSLADGPPPKDICFHCMAGKSRSQLATIAYLYFNKIGTPKNPDASPIEIANHIKGIRKGAKAVDKMDGDQAGLLGLMALHEETLRSKQDGYPTSPETYAITAQNIGLTLKDPLDLGFREQSDLDSQIRDLKTMHQQYAAINSTPPGSLNLLAQMLAPPGTLVENAEENYQGNFDKLSPSQQARFAILAQKIPEGDRVLPPKYGTPLDYAKAAAALGVKDKLSTGDQVELLRSFGEDCGLTFNEVTKRIATGTGVDSYNADIQSAKLSDAATKAPSRIDKVIAAGGLISTHESTKAQAIVQRATPEPPQIEPPADEQQQTTTRKI